MYDVVKKVVAREGFNRVTLESSYDEMLKFTEAEIRPDFMDESILAIKFIVEACEGDDTPEQTDWYINPVYFKGEGGEFPYNLTLEFDFVPEIILLDVPTVYAKNKYTEFHVLLLREDGPELSEEEKYNLFWKQQKKCIKGYMRHNNI